jgi:hypothetical protein
MISGRGLSTLPIHAGWFVFLLLQSPTSETLRCRAISFNHRDALQQQLHTEGIAPCAWNLEESTGLWSLRTGPHLSMRT